MLELIIDFAQADERIRTVLITGSRTNPNADRDIFRDFDVDCYVTDVEPFREEQYVVPRFGKAILVEKPEDHIYSPGAGDGRYTYNMQLADGNRVNLQFFPLATYQDRSRDSQTAVILDKDGLTPDLPRPSERSHFIKEPTRHEFGDCCEAFFFCLGSHIPKTLWRKKLPLLNAFIEGLRRDLVTMLKWEIGVREGFEISVGVAGKHLEKHLELEVWTEFERTYAGADYDEIYESLLTFYRLVKSAGESVAQHYRYTFPVEDGERVLAFLQHVRKLPQDAESIF